MDLIDKVIRNEIRELIRIKDTSEDRFDYLRMDKNECLINFNNDLLREFINKINSSDLSAYPELDSLYQKLSKFLEVDKEQIFLAAGSDLAIRSIYEACIQKGDNVILPSPSYAMFRVYASMFGAEFDMIKLNEKWEIDVNEMLGLIDKNTKLFVLENPNGSVGTMPSLKDIELCAAELYKKNILFIIDEVYYYIDNISFNKQELIKKYPNTIVVQSFSKSHGLAGMRIGYLIGDKRVIQYISRTMPMHEITSLSYLSAHWVLDNPEILFHIQHSIKTSKEYLKRELDRIQIQYRDNHGNFILLYVPDSGKTKDLPMKIKEMKILMRRPFEESYLNGWTRITVPELDDAKIFIQALKSIIN